MNNKSIRTYKKIIGIKRNNYYAKNIQCFITYSNK